MVVAAIFSPPPLERVLVVAAVVVASQAPSSLPLFSPSPLLAAATLPPALERVAAATAILPPALERVAATILGRQEKGFPRVFLDACRVICAPSHALNTDSCCCL